jgi:hypothetical protein
MPAKNFVVLPAVFALAACSGGDSGTTTPSQDVAQLLAVPIAEREPVNFRTVEDAEAGISSLSEGDAFTLPVSEIVAGEGGTLTFVIGNTVGDLTILASTSTSGDPTSIGRSVAITNLSKLFKESKLEFEEPEDTEFNSEQFDVNGTTISIEIGEGTDFGEVSASSGNLEDNSTIAHATRYVQDGKTQIELSANTFGTFGTFGKPTGDFDYSGKGIVAWDEYEAIGDVTMTADFDTNTGSLNAPNLLSPVESNATASFAGDIEIEDTTGHYTSTDANIKVNGSRYDAGIIGTFNVDATESSGTVFDVNTQGETAVGAFSVAKDQPK